MLELFKALYRHDFFFFFFLVSICLASTVITASSSFYGKQAKDTDVCTEWVESGQIKTKLFKNTELFSEVRSNSDNSLEWAFCSASSSLQWFKRLLVLTVARLLVFKADLELRKDGQGNLKCYKPCCYSFCWINAF